MHILHYHQYNHCSKGLVIPTCIHTILLDQVGLGEVPIEGSPFIYPYAAETTFVQRTRMLIF